MGWFNNMKISARLLTGFSVIVVITIALSIISYTNFSSYSEADKWNIHTYKVLSDLDGLITSMVNMETGQRGFTITGDENFLQPYKDGKSSFDKYYNDVKQLTSDNQTQQSNLQQIYDLHEKWSGIAEKLIELRRNVNKGINKLDDILKQEEKAEGKSTMDKLREVIATSQGIENTLLIKRIDDSNDLHSNTNLVIIIGTILVIILAIIIGLLCTFSITNGIKKITIAAENIARGITNIDIGISSKDEIGVLATTFRKMIDAIVALVADANILETAAIEGKLSTRADTSKHSGDYAKIVDGVNKTLDAVIDPLNVAADYVDKISKGDIPPKITETYNGDFNNIKNNLNKCIDSINGLILEMNNMSTQHDAGDIDIVINTDKFEGAYNVMGNGVNKMVQGHIIVKKKAMACIAEFGKGNFEAELEKFPGKKAFINETIEHVRKNLKALITDADMLVKAAVDGQLSTRADASKHQGDFAKIVDGVNRTLDAVIEPVKEAASVLTEMANGNLQMRVVGNYRGDHADIKNALNGTLDSLSTYVGEIAYILGEMANSNLELSITSEYKGDFAKIKDALNLIIGSLNTVLGDINEASDQVASGSRQVSDGSQALSQGATEQASAIEEFTASITQVASQTKQNAVNATQANELAGLAKNNAELGNTHMKEMLKSMEEINESSTSISKIIKVIDEIAFQTNILALNAAVEAARAGQHGKGFAVVAEEVRNLAARSANAAKETTALIEGSIKKVEAGTKIANETANSLDMIVNGVAKAADLVGEIATASNEQASAIVQINQGIEQVSVVTQTNSATAEESAAASEELSAQAGLLKEMVGKFKIKTRWDREDRSELEFSSQSKIPKRTMLTQNGRNGKQDGHNNKLLLGQNEFGKY